MTAPGLPDGWRGSEAEELRFGVWRFYRVVDPDRESSVREDNWVTRDGVAMPGEEGLRVFLEDVCSGGDLERVPASRLAAQLGRFLIRGSSRQGCAVRVVDDAQHGATPPARALDGDRLVITAWFQRDGYRQRVQVEHTSDGGVAVRWGEPVVTG